MLDEETLRSMLPGHFGQQGKNELPTAQEPNEASQEEEKVLIHANFARCWKETVFAQE